MVRGERLDVALVARGLVASRSAAAALIRDGRVSVDGDVAVRAAHPVHDDALLEVDDPGWVGRGALKLQAAIDEFGTPVAGLLALDVGASTGGFTQVLLERGARRVLALDVGHDQLDARLRDDPRVTAVDGVNARGLTPLELARLTGETSAPGVVVADVSFISLRLLLPALAAVAAPDAHMVLLVKPQFEVGRVRDGVVRDPDARVAAVRAVLADAWQLGLGTAGVLASPVLGAAGNVEVLVALGGRAGSHPTEWDDLVREAAGRTTGVDAR